MTLEYTGQASYYRCTECGGEFDLKHGEHACETREELLEAVEAAREILGEWRKADEEGAPTGDPESYLRRLDEALRE